MNAALAFVEFQIARVQNMVDKTTQRRDRLRAASAARCPLADSPSAFDFEPDQELRMVRLGLAAAYYDGRLRALQEVRERLA